MNADANITCAKAVAISDFVIVKRWLSGTFAACDGSENATDINTDNISTLALIMLAPNAITAIMRLISSPSYMMILL